MKEKEAIEMLKAVKGYVKYGGVDESINMAISALEKQIPKKPKLYRRSYWCSVCEGRITAGKNYCGNCGQTIDWSDEE